MSSNENIEIVQCNHSNWKEPQQENITLMKMMLALSYDLLHTISLNSKKGHKKIHNSKCFSKYELFQKKNMIITASVRCDVRHKISAYC